MTATSLSAFPSLHTALHSQRRRLEERRSSPVKNVQVADMNLAVFPGVYDTGIDTQLMCDVMNIRGGSLVAEVGIGCGACSLFAAQRASFVVGTDINPRAVENSRWNADRHACRNAQFIETNILDGVVGCFDVVLCNPPYNAYEANDCVDAMFWDTNNAMKERFFREVVSRLSPQGKVLWGWADFADIQLEWPVCQASKHGLHLSGQWSRPSTNRRYSFMVLEFSRTP